MGLRIYTGGTFDLFHSNHAKFLARCASLGSVTVALNTDEFIYEYKKKKPVMTYEERAEVLRSCRYVDDVIPNYGGADSRITIEIVKPNLIVIGSDWARRDYYAQMGFTQDWLDERGIGLCYFPYGKGVSSTDIKSRLSGRM